MAMKNLVGIWSLPDRTAERIQITLRIPFTDYARLHALKEVYPTRSVNDILSDIIRVGLDEIVEALPSWPASDEDVNDWFEHNQPPSDLPPSYYLHQGELIGPAVGFDNAYRQILKSKSDDGSKEQAA
jgi:hypothetical protein